METIPHRVLANAIGLKDDPALIRRVGDDWEPITWGEYGASVERTARALIASGIQPGDRLAILSYNTPEWVIFSVATMAVGAVPVGLYYASTAEEISEMLERSNARVVLCQTASLAGKIDTEALDDLELLIVVEDAPDGIVGWDEFLERGETGYTATLSDRLDAIDPEQPGTVIFTAAGYGRPMGVVLSHENLVFAAQSSVDLFDVTQSDSALSYLPLSHIAEQIFTILAPALTGYPVAFSQSLGRVRVGLPEIQPSIFFGVPLVWSGLEAGLRKQVDGLAGIERRVAAWAMKVNRKNIATRNAGKKLSGYQKASGALASNLFSDMVKSIMGFENSRLAFTGAATPDPEMLEYFAGVDIVIRDVYGLSESTGPSSITREGATRFGTVGHPMPRVEIVLADDGEILIKGGSVFLGYLDDEDATANALRDGWLHTGDLGAYGSDGMLTITGRKKGIIVTSGGKNVDAAAIEPLIEDDESVINAVLVGDGYDQLGIMVSVDDSFDSRDAALSHVQAVVKVVNRRFARAEQVRRVGLLPRALSVEKGERDATGAKHRATIVGHFAVEISDLYS
ncbi:MAG: AMP-binding protein [Actinomycetia bacterium]|nr:AMP-binding protein [Actinomycetes bacterium]